jgi:hypothetical protein
MKRTHLFRSAVAAATAFLMAVSARAAELITMTDYNTTETTATSGAPPAAASGGQAACCDSSACNGCPHCCCDNSHQFECYWFSGIDSFKGVADGEFGGNNGFLNGLNSGFAVPGLSEYGIGAQAGASWGIYDLSGHEQSGGVPTDQAVQQVFVTLGVFRRPDADLPIGAGIVYDAMFAYNFGIFGSSPTLGQWRGQASYMWDDCNEFGAWGTYRDHSFSNSFGALGGPLQFRAVDQLDFFWHHKFGECGADARFYVGLPTEDRLAQTPTTGLNAGGSGGKLGSFILGCNFEVPLNDRLSLFANGTYMPPSQGAGQITTTPGTAVATVQESWDISFGINIYLGGSCSRSATVAGNTFAPYMPVANNGSFLVDQNPTL